MLKILQKFLCFHFLIQLLRVHYINSTNNLFVRGAELFDKRLVETVDKSRANEELEIQRIQSRVNEIKERSRRLGVEQLQYHHEGALFIQLLTNCNSFSYTILPGSLFQVL